MGIFDMFKKKDNDETSLVQKVNLAKEEVHKVCLDKKPLINLKAKVALVLDYSGSMDWLYSNGTVQRVVEKMLPLAMNFDDDGSMETWLFSDSCRRLKDANLNNLDGYIKRETKGKSMGGTNYSPVMEDIIKFYKNEKLPVYVIFITDGDNFDNDKTDTTATIIEAAKKPIFWQFVGLGDSKFSYLESLDTLEGRYVDNADFFSVKNADDITYKDLLTEFPTWLSDQKVKDMLV
jgi:uncharacterized protein with von Willebrand factor type A (vWA) domain